MGHANPFVTGERKWTANYKPVGSGVVQAVPAKAAKPEAKPSLASAGSVGAVLGNRNSHVYHLSVGCPGYTQVTAKNQVTFATEGEAQAAGYRKAGNCR